MKKKLRIIIISFLLIMNNFFSIAPVLQVSANEGEETSSISEVIDDTIDGVSDEVADEESPIEDSTTEEVTESQSEQEELQQGEVQQEEVQQEELQQEDNVVVEEEVEEEPENLLDKVATFFMEMMPFGTQSASIMPPEDVMTSTEFTVGGQTVTGPGPVTVQNGQTAQFKFNMELAAGHDYGPGTTMTYTLPNIFTNITFPQGTKFGDLGDITKNGNDIIITFNENIHDGLNGTGFEPGAHFYIAATFNNIGNNVNERIDLPGQANIALNFTPLNGQPITKNNGIAYVDNGGNPIQSNTNSDYIEWKVTVNTDLKNTSNPVTFTDTLSANNGSGHKFATSSVTITELTMKPDGNVLSRTPAGITPTFTGSNTVMTISLDGTKAYEITYNTIPDDPGNNEFITYKNSATYGTAHAVTKEATVNYGTPLSKEYSGPNANLETTWTIKYNFNKRTITQGNAKLTDSWSTTGGSGSKTQVMSEFNVYEENGTTPVSGDEWTRTDNGQGFTLQFNQTVTKPYVIKYKTKPASDTYITSNMTVTNTVTRSDVTLSKGDTVTYSKNNFMLNKSAGNVNYANKTIPWTITANQAGYSLDAGTTFKDTFTNPNMELKEETLVVTVGSEKLTEGVGYTLTNRGKVGFDITLTNGTNQQVVITYTTDYDIRDIGSNNREFQNNVKINNSGLPAAPSDSATRSVATEQTANGKKTGVYNYKTKQFEWEVELNFNYNTLTNAIFEDVLPNTQTIDVESIKVVKGTLNSAGVFQPGEDVDVTNTATEPHKIAFSLGAISVPYKVTYKSYDTDRVFPETAGKVQITNNATLKDGAAPNASWTKTVGVNYTDKLITKKGSQIQSTAGIKWNFEFNYAQSDLKNIVITDTVGKDGEGNPNQLIKPDSFKVYQVELSGKSDSASYNATKQNTLLTTRAEYDPNGTVQAGTYQLNVNIQEGKFELKLPDGDSAYYIEYETIYMGDNGLTVENAVQVNYVSNDGNQASNNFSISNFRYGNSGTTVKVPFVVVKTDGATGEPMEDVEFTLYSDFQSGVALLSKKTDENGIFDLGMKLTEGNYTLKETTVAGYDNPGDIRFKLDRKSVEKSGPYNGKQIVEVENFKTGSGTMCPQFTLTIKDVDRNIVANKNVTLTNKATGQVHTLPTNGAGEITLTSDKVKAGLYTATINEGGTDVTLGEVTVTYNGTCQYELQPQPKCNLFTITIKDTKEIVRPNVTVTLKHRTDSTAPEIIATTDANGQFTVPSATQTGVYKVYEGKQYLGDVTITYKNSPCEATVIEVPTCEMCTLTVRDVDGNPREAGVAITIKDKDGQEMETGLTTDSDGKVRTTKPLPAGEYDVFEGDSPAPFDTFTTNIACENDVQPKPICPNFTVTVRDVDSNLFEKGIAITLKNKVTNQEAAAETNENGKVSIPSENLPAGQYDVYNGGIKLGELTVSYKNGCTAEIQQTPSCENFTLSVKDTEGKPFAAGVQIELKDKEGNSVVTAITDANSIVTVPSINLPAGTYDVYANGEFLSEIVVSYKDSCNAAILRLALDDKGKIFKKDLIKKVRIKQIKQDGSNKESDVDEDGVFSVEGLEPGEHEFVVVVELEDGSQLVMGKITVTINPDGEITNIHEELVDPYGKITDSKTGDVIGGVEVELYYADTPRNRANGRTPGMLVDLPELPGFAPSNNKNPQTSVSVPVWNDDVSDYGNYAWLVFPKGDYYIVAKKPGYEDYRSPTISVEYNIVKHDFEMEPIQSSDDGASGGGTLGGGTPGGGTPGGGTPGGGTPSGGTPGGGTPSGGIPDGGTPSGGTPSGGTPDGGTPSGGTPDGGTPSGGTPGGGTPDGGTPGGGTPGEGIPDGGTPSGGTSSGSTPSGSTPDGGSVDKSTNVKGSDKSNSQTTKRSLPQTGEERNLPLLFVGILLLIVGASLMIFKRKIKAL